MSNHFAMLLTCVVLGSFGVAHAQKTPDPQTDGASTGARDPYTDGARAGKFDPYTEGANKSTQENLNPSGTVNSPRDPYSQGARSGPRDPYSDGARTLNRDYPFDTTGHVNDRRNPFFQGG